jgi:Ca2+-binding EF-hand superfamily protein
MTTINTIQELENLIIEYRGDQNARIAIRECIEIIKKNEGK